MTEETPQSRLIRKLVRENKRLQPANDLLKIRLRNVQSKIDSVRRKRDELRARNERQAEEIRDLKTSLARMQWDRDELQDQLNKLEKNHE